MYRHVKDLRHGDGIWVGPSLVATLFLESSGSRFEWVSTRSLSDWSRMCEVWRLLNGLGITTTALRGAWATLDDARQRWEGPDGRWLEGAQDAWLLLVRSVIGDRLGARGAALDALVEAARADLLGSCLAWYMKVLKLSVGEVSK